MHYFKIISLSVPINFFKPNVATPSEVSYEKLVVVFAADIKYVEGEWANQKEEMVLET
jgi:hypothetical protein